MAPQFLSFLKKEGKALESLTAEKLIKHFEERIHDVDRHTRGLSHGKTPRYPQLTVFLGDAARNGFDIVSSGLSAAWPAFKDELCYLGLKEGDNLQFHRLPTSGADECLNPQEFDEELANLFGEHVHFQDMGILYIYYLMETSSFQNIEDFEMWLNTIHHVKQHTSLSDVPSGEVLFVLLDKSFAHRKIAVEIIKWLAENKSLYADLSVVMLSNNRSDGHILRNWDTCYRIATATMLITNNTDRSVAGLLAGNGLFTARYIREDKPLADIGQVIVESVVERFRESIEVKAQAEISDEELAGRLGLTNEGTLSVLDNYIEQELAPRLPSSIELDFYPRLEDSDYGSLSSLSAKDFDELTMGTWSLVLENLIAEAKEDLRSNMGVRREWTEEYSRYLRSMFTPLELINLKNYIDEVRGLLAATPRSSVREGRVLDSAVWELRAALSSDNDIIRLFGEVIEEQAERADTYFTAFNQLADSLGYLHELSDETLGPFYEVRVSNYFDRMGNSLLQRFWALSGSDELYEFLCNVIDDIIGSDSIFVAPFEEELEQRLGDDSRGKETRDFIRRRLMGEGVPQYLRTAFNLGRPLVGAILLKTGTKLHRSLSSTPQDESYYYNIGYGNAAERLELYQLDPLIITN